MCFGFFNFAIFISLFFYAEHNIRCPLEVFSSLYSEALTSELKEKTEKILHGRWSLRKDLYFVGKEAVF